MSAADLQLRITSDPAHLAPVRRELERFCAQFGFDDAARGEIVLCVNEALTNITRHAYGGATDRPVHLDASFSDNTLQVSLRDWGSGKKPKDFPAVHEPLCPGGVGLVCLHKLMDDIRFIPQPDGMLLTMKRSL